MALRAGISEQTLCQLAGGTSFSVAVNGALSVRGGEQSEQAKTIERLKGELAERDQISSSRAT